MGGSKDAYSEYQHIRHAPDRMRAKAGMLCPKCWSEDVDSHGEWDGEGADPGEVILVFTCNGCGCKWINIYMDPGDGNTPVWTDFKLWENLLDER